MLRLLERCLEEGSEPGNLDATVMRKCTTSIPLPILEDQAVLQLTSPWDSVRLHFVKLLGWCCAGAKVQHMTLAHRQPDTDRAANSLAFFRLCRFHFSGRASSSSSPALRI